MSITFCLDCDRAIDLGHDPQVGQRAVCPHCETRLEVINLDPMEVDWVYDGPAVNLNIFERRQESSNWLNWR